MKNQFTMFQVVAILCFVWDVCALCLCVHTCECSCAAAFICVYKSSSLADLGISHDGAPPHLYRSLSVPARLTKQQASGASCFCPHSTRAIGLCHHTQIWCRCWGSELRLSCLYSMYFTHWAISQALQFYLRFNIIDEIYVIYI